MTALHSKVQRRNPMSVAVLTDSNSGVTAEEAKANGLFVQPMPFYIDGELFYEGINLSGEDFYKKQTGGSEISTSMPIVGDLVDNWEKLLEDFDEIVYIPMSSGLSSSCETAVMLADDYDGRVQVVNNQRISVTQKLSVYEAKKMAEDGRSAAEIRTYLEYHKMDSSLYIMVDTLEYLKKGGRITPAVAAIGSLLHIRPVLQIQGEKLDTFAKARTLKQAKQIIIDALKQDYETRFAGMTDLETIVSIAHTENPEEAEIFREELKQAFPEVKSIRIDPLSLSVACHIGPGALAATVSKALITL